MSLQVRYVFIIGLLLMITGAIWDTWDKAFLVCEHNDCYYDNKYPQASYTWFSGFAIIVCGLILLDYRCEKEGLYNRVEDQ